jgi:hypothetical protein
MPTLTSDSHISTYKQTVLMSEEKVKEYKTTLAKKMKERMNHIQEKIKKMQEEKKKEQENK